MKKIYLTESQMLSILRSQLLENSDLEGFSFGSRGRGSDGKFRFTPGKNDTNTDTTIFDDNGNFKVNMVKLPKSGIISYNLYKITNMQISRALKHADEDGIVYDKPSIDSFMKRTALYIKHIIGNRPVDIITYPQSSSAFNRNMVDYLMKLFPNTEGIKIVPNMLIKNVNTVYVNTDVAKQVGLTDDEIHYLQSRVEKWRKDESLRDLRRRIEELENEIMAVKNQRKRGRPSKEFTTRQELLNNLKQQVPLMRRGMKGRDGTVDKNGSVKDFQIKSIGDKERRSIEGLFQINPEYNGIQQKLRGKNIVIFDDNISSGATLDDMSIRLMELGVKSILPITLAVIPKTVYGGKHERI